MKKIRFISLFVLSLLWSISANVIHPITTNYVNDLALPTFYFGIFFSLMSLGQVLGAIFFGRLSDKIGRKIPLCIGIIGYGIFQLCFGNINKYPLLILVFRVLGGFFAAAPVTLFVTFSLDLFNDNNRVKCLSLLASLKFLGEAIGYFIGGQLYSSLNLTFQQVFLVQALICLFTAIGGFVFLKEEAKVKVKKEKEKIKNISSLGMFICLFLIAIFLIAMGQININKYFDVYFIDIGYNSADLGTYVLLTGALGFLGSLFLMPLFKKEEKVKVEFILPLILIISSLSVFLTFNSDKKYFIYLIYSSHLIYIICRICIVSLEQSYLAKLSSKENHGLYMGLMQSVLSFGNVVAPLLGSIVYKPQNVFVFNLAAILILLGLFILLGIFFKAKKQH